MSILGGVKSVVHALKVIGDATGVGRPVPGMAPTTPQAGLPGAVSVKQPGGHGGIEDYKIVGRSTISRKVFADALLHMASPAIVDLANQHITVDFADELYDIAVAWGVNPAVALGFFQHESSGGTKGYAAKTRNWGNLRSGRAELSNDGSFAYYSSWAVGLDDFCRTLVGSLYVKDGLDTVGKVTPRYAPSGDNNDPKAYADAVNTQIAVWESMA